MVEGKGSCEPRLLICHQLTRSRTCAKPADNAPLVGCKSSRSVRVTGCSFYGFCKTIGSPTLNARPKDANNLERLLHFCQLVRFRLIARCAFLLETEGRSQGVRARKGVTGFRTTLRKGPRGDALQLDFWS